MIKREFFFSHNTPQACRDSICSILGTNPTTQFEKYLGLPSIVGRAKRRAFNEIKDRVWRRLQGWNEKLLSQAGREILIKAVIQAIPTYAMSCFKLPAGLCADISAMATRFWWGQRGSERKIHWLSRHRLNQPKKKGGIGFRDLQLFNKALLARQGWRIMQCPASLVSRVLKAKYFPHSSFLEAQIPSNASYTWQSICEAKEVLIMGLRWQVGSGEKIKVWHDKWIPSPSTYKVISPISSLADDATVDQLINPVTIRWDVSMLESVFLARDVDLIQSIPLSKRKPKDVLIWHETKSGYFSVKSAYGMLLANQSAPEASSSSSEGSVSQCWSAIWSASVQPKIRVFLWRACKGILPTQAKLFDRGISHTYSCLWCGEDAEIVDHVLWQCEFAQRVWKECSAGLPLSFDVNWSFMEFITRCSLDLASPALEIAYTTAWVISKARNDLIWNDHLSTVSDICQQAAVQAIDYIESCDNLAVARPGVAGPSFIKWLPPDRLNFKLNLSCVMGLENSQLGLGVLVRDSMGFVGAARCSRMYGGFMD